MWMRYQKRLPTRGRTASSSTRKKIIWKWIPKANNAPNHHSSSPYKQALLSNLNGDGFDGQKSANEVVEEGVRVDLFDNSNPISQPLDNGLSRPIFVEEFPSQQLPSCRSSLEGDEEMDSSRRPFDGPLEMKLQHHEKCERSKLSSKDKKRNNKSPKSAQHLPTRVMPN
ncbi:hypothetical protein Cgig2_027856 [Carnegiea gigantea]|uniref:Uncharacterized protein n=1 Tax=Carnegiea gigantea TaxID=171969 RepID=A0A9Q1JTI7_9CARY|nr:hypothetical protein Cgig2_027856 [Carnegiea gigantea]